jgi:uncharacterized protein YjbI with pentapeptide repeats
MGTLDDGDVANHRVLKPRTVVWIFLIVIAGCVGVATALFLAFGRADPATSIEATKALVTIAISSGGVVAFWLAVRRQHALEIGLRQKDRELRQQERDREYAVADALEQRVNELYTMAADQLGSDHAHVRVAGMYALERLAQNNPAHRQVVVNVLCAYLRMPDHVDSDAGSEAGPAPALRHDQEMQVRLTAQRILATHLRRQPNPETFWPDTDLDLAGAALNQFDFGDCEVREASFDGARFHGRTTFTTADFTGTVSFRQATFLGEAVFDRATFRDADFHDARFLDRVEFHLAQFEDDVAFTSAQFAGVAFFFDVTFKKEVTFGTSRNDGASFDHDAVFERTRFADRVVIRGTTFRRDTLFTGAEFEKFTAFHNAVFGAYTTFLEARFHDEVRFHNAVFEGQVEFDNTEFGHGAFAGASFRDRVSFTGARFLGGSTCDGAKVRTDVDDPMRSWPDGWTLTPLPDSDTETGAVGQRWARLGMERQPSDPGTP